MWELLLFNIYYKNICFWECIFLHILDKTSYELFLFDTNSIFYSVYLKKNRFGRIYRESPLIGHSSYIILLKYGKRELLITCVLIAKWAHELLVYLRTRRHPCLLSGLPISGSLIYPYICTEHINICGIYPFVI